MRVPIAIAVALASATVWLSLLLAPGLPLPAVAGLTGYYVPPFVLPLAGMALTVAIIVLRPAWMGVAEPQMISRVLGGVVCATLLIALAAMLMLGIQSGEIKPVAAALVLILATVTLVIALYALESVRAGGGVSFDSNWGGLGGGMGGWRLSPTAIYLVLLLAFAGSMVGVALYSPEQTPPSADAVTAKGAAAAKGKAAGTTQVSPGSAGKAAAPASKSE